MCHTPIFRNIPKIIYIKTMFYDFNVVKLEINKKNTTSIPPTFAKIKAYFSIIYFKKLIWAFKNPYKIKAKKYCI